MIDFTVRPDHGDEYEIKAESRDVLVWEKTSKGRSFTDLMEHMYMADLYKLAHIAAKRLGAFDGTLADFEESVDLMFVADEVDPTQPAASPGP